MEVDWIEGTIVDKPVRVALPLVKGLLAAVDWQELDRGGYGYECSAMVADSGRVFWSLHNPRMGVHVSLPSSAISVLCADPAGLLRELVSLGMKVTRVDFAFDDKSGLLDLEQIGQSVEAKNYVSRSRKWTFMKNEEGGQTWAFGRRSSDSFIRTYDKAAEQHVDGHWVRVELELKDKRAEAAVHVLLSCGVESWPERVASWLRGLLEFKEPGTDENKSRWEIAKWWESFLESAKKSTLTISKRPRTVEELRVWVDEQVGPSLSVLSLALGGDEILRIIDRGSERLKPKHLAMISSALSKGEKRGTEEGS
jgi:putative DNA relaxase